MQNTFLVCIGDLFRVNAARAAGTRAGLTGMPDGRMNSVIELAGKGGKPADGDHVVHLADDGGQVGGAVAVDRAAGGGGKLPG